MAAAALAAALAIGVPAANAAGATVHPHPSSVQLIPLPAAGSCRDGVILVTYAGGNARFNPTAGSWRVATGSTYTVVNVCNDGGNYTIEDAGTFGYMDWEGAASGGVIRETTNGSLARAHWTELGCGTSYFELSNVSPSSWETPLPWKVMASAHRCTLLPTAAAPTATRNGAWGSSL